MKAFFSSARLFILGFVLLLVVNGIVLWGVSLNRSGEPEAMIELTERELSLPTVMNDENSGLALCLDWRVIPKRQDENDLFPGDGSHWGNPVWFNEQKLKELGFAIDMFTCPEKKSKQKKHLPKDAYIVLEYDGNAYQEALKRAERLAEKAATALQANIEDKSLKDRFKNTSNILEGEKISKSRLFAIDAGLDAVKLRERYSDRSKFIILPGIVELECLYENNEREIRGSISKIMVEGINVPLVYRKIFESILAQSKSDKNEGIGSVKKFILYNRGIKGPRYKVELAYGSRFEPWIQRVEKLIE